MAGQAGRIWHSLADHLVIDDVATSSDPADQGNGRRSSDEISNISVERSGYLKQRAKLDVAILIVEQIANGRLAQPSLLGERLILNRLAFHRLTKCGSHPLKLIHSVSHVCCYTLFARKRIGVQ